MKLNGIPTRTHTSAVLSLLLLGIQAPISAKSVRVGGYIPELRHLAVTPSGPVAIYPLGGPVEVAIIEIDNNLPNYEVALDFSGPDGDGPAVSEVHLIGEEGLLGTGLTPPQGAIPQEGSQTGRFVWSPGPQKSATLGYRIKVLVTYARPEEERPPLYVSVNVPY